MTKSERIAAWGLIFLHDSPEMLVQEAEPRRLGVAREWTKQPLSLFLDRADPTELATIVAANTRNTLYTYEWYDHPPNELRNEKVPGKIIKRVVGADVIVLWPNTNEAFAELTHAEAAAIELIARGYCELHRFNAHIADTLLSSTFTYAEALTLVTLRRAEVEQVLSHFAPPLLELSKSCA